MHWLHVAAANRACLRRDSIFAALTHAPVTAGEDSAPWQRTIRLPTPASPKVSACVFIEAIWPEFQPASSLATQLSGQHVNGARTKKSSTSRIAEIPGMSC